MDRISVIGYFGFISGKLDGQTVKTRTVHRLLCDYLPEAPFFDTERFQKNPLSLLSLLWLVARSNRILYLPAHNNLKYIFPLVWIVALLCRTKISYIVVGGWLAEYLETKPLHRFLLKKIDGIYPENEIQKKALEERYHFHNVEIFPNFRYSQETGPDSSALPNKKDVLRLVFMARIMRAKGIGMIFELGKYIKENRLDEKVIIDFFGQINPEDEDYFKTCLMDFPFMAYKGVLPPDKIHSTLKSYDAMLFPTHYPGEGHPGSVIDSFIAGLPVIATEWRYAHEFIKDKENGFIVPYENGQDEFNKVIAFCLQSPETISEMKKNAAKTGEAFTQKTVKKTFERIIGTVFCFILLSSSMFLTACSGDNDIDDAISSSSDSSPAPFFHNNPLPQGVEQLRILSISNSFSLDPTYYIDEIADATGIDKKHYCVYVAFHSNAALSYWQDVLETGDSIKLMHQAGLLEMKSHAPLKEILEQPWDIVVMHQVSSMANNYKSYNPYLQNIITQVLRGCPNNDVSFAWQLVWSYGNNDATMWRSFCLATQKQMAIDGIDNLIPTGTAIQNARSRKITGNNLTRDGKHLSRGVACYIAACTWFETLFAPAFGVSVFGRHSRHELTEKELSDKELSINAKAVDDSNYEECLQCVADAIAHPFETYP